MIITNLLDKIVTLGETTGKICAIFGENQHGCSVAIIADDGKIHIGYLSQVTVPNHRGFYVVVFFDMIHKIRVIKLTREVRGTGLREAKEFVEKGGNSIKIKENLNAEEADAIKKLVEDDGLEAEIRKHIPSLEN